jgi:hypothetical protein
VLAAQLLEVKRTGLGNYLFCKLLFENLPTGIASRKNLIKLSNGGEVKKARQKCPTIAGICQAGKSW